MLPLLVLPAVAGVIDGLVLPGDYARLRQWGEVSSSNLAAFDAGALLSEALLLAAFAAAAAFIGRTRIETGDPACILRAAGGRYRRIGVRGLRQLLAAQYSVLKDGRRGEPIEVSESGLACV